MPQIPQIPQKISLVVTNATGSTIPKRSVVYAVGASGGKISIGLAKANSKTTLPSIGVTEEDIATGNDGTVVVYGELANVSTAGFSLGTTYYVSASTAGDFTSTKPVSPNLAQAIVIPLTSGASASMWVDARNFLPEVFSTANNGLVPVPIAAEVTARRVLNADGTWGPIVGGDTFRGSGTVVNFEMDGSAAGCFFYFQNNATAEYMYLLFDPLGGVNKYWDFGTYGTPNSYFFLSAPGRMVIADPCIGTAKVANPATVGPTLYSSNYPAFYAGTDDKAYFKNGAGTITQLTAPMVTQDEGVQVALNTKTMNFAGAGVTATAVGETVTVNIPGVVNAATTGTVEVDFGAFPGASDASVAVTGQAGILAGSIVECWLRLAATTDHTADEHLVETIKVSCGNIVAGTGFTIYAVNTNQVNEPLTPAYGTNNSTISGATLPSSIQTNQRGGSGTRLWGKWSVQWRWV